MLDTNFCIYKYTYFEILYIYLFKLSFFFWWPVWEERNSQSESKREWEDSEWIYQTSDICFSHFSLCHARFFFYLLLPSNGNIGIFSASTSIFMVRGWYGHLPPFANNKQSVMSVYVSMSSVFVRWKEDKFIFAVYSIEIIGKMKYSRTLYFLHPLLFRLSIFPIFSSDFIFFLLNK